MLKSEYAISELRGVAVYDAKKPNRRIGKAHSFVFHPQKRRVVGFTVKRPDIAFVAHRSELFVAIDAFDIVDGHILISEDKASTGKAACKRLGVSWDECIVWQGMPLFTEDGQRCGRVGDVCFNTQDGAVTSLTIDKGASSDLLLGFTEVPAEYILGFKFGVGDPLTAANEEGDDFLRGAIMVAPEVLQLSSEGGLAARAGAATAVAGNKASQAIDAAKPVVADAAERVKPHAQNAAQAANEAVQKVRPKAEAAAQVAEEAVNEGAYKLGQQLFKAKGMFAGFKEEYHRALEDDQDKK